MTPGVEGQGRGIRPSRKASQDKPDKPVNAKADRTDPVGLSELLNPFGPAGPNPSSEPWSRTPRRTSRRGSKGGFKGGGYFAAAPAQKKEATSCARSRIIRSSGFGWAGLRFQRLFSTMISIWS